MYFLELFKTLTNKLIHKTVKIIFTFISHQYIYIYIYILKKKN
jgi:hypothetical protein